jgi:UDP-N-acetylmuramoyl-L-alanyl-D-glutamate--2,6-diaminopimelate ligase
MPCVSFGINEPSNSFAINMKYGLDGTRFVANIIDDVFNVSVPFVGEYNIYNLLASLTVAKMIGISHDDIKYAINRMQVIDGRFNMYKSGDKKIIIDFAHTPDSILQLLNHIKIHTYGNIISVFGCVGYSDRDKRIEMAEAVAKYSDKIVVTTDNRGYTKFSDICNDIIVGLNNKEFTCIEDRYEAIKYAYSIMQDNDVLVIMGKGAEDFQTIEGKRISYSDKESVMNIIGVGY